MAVDVAEVVDKGVVGVEARKGEGRLQEGRHYLYCIFFFGKSIFCIFLIFVFTKHLLDPLGQYLILCHDVPFCAIDISMTLKNTFF